MESKCSAGLVNRQGVLSHNSREGYTAFLDNYQVDSTKITFICEEIGMSKKVDIYIILRFYAFIYCATKVIIKYNDLYVACATKYCFGTP